MFVYAVLMGASLLALAGVPWWVVPIGAALLLLVDHRELNTTTARDFSLSVAMKFARNIVFVGISFALGLVAGWLSGAGSN